MVAADQLRSLSTCRLRALRACMVGLEAAHALLNHFFVTATVEQLKHIICRHFRLANGRLKVSGMKSSCEIMCCMTLTINIQKLTMLYDTDNKYTKTAVLTAKVLNPTISRWPLKQCYREREQLTPFDTARTRESV